MAKQTANNKKLYDNRVSVLRKNATYLRGIKDGIGFATYSVDQLKVIIMDDWRQSFDKFSSEELAKHKMARLRFAMEKNPARGTHRVIVIDNVDHLPPDLQTKIVDNAIWLAEFLHVRLLIAVRPLTWENQHGHKTLEIEEHLAPSLADVICSRLSYILEYDEASVDVIYATRWLISELRDDRSHLRNLLYGSSGVSVRAALRNFRNFLASPIHEEHGHEQLRPSELARAYFLGGEQSIDHDNIDDLYSVGNIRTIRLALLKPRLIDYILRANGGRANVLELFYFLMNFGYLESEISRAIDELMIRKRSIIWSNSFHRFERRSEVKDKTIMAISPIGASYYARLLGEYLYTEACMASDRSHVVAPVEVIEFSRRLIIEDEDQIREFLSRKSAADYYSVYGLEFPSIAYLYWRRFVRGAFARQGGRSSEQAIIDPSWESRIRGFLEGVTGKKYLAAERR